MMRKILYIAIAWLLVSCCSVSDSQQFVDGFYQTLYEQDQESALTYLNPDVTIYDERIDDLSDDVTVEEYIERLIQTFKDSDQTITNLSCKVNTISWNEEICKGNSCEQYEIEFLEFDELIIDIEAIRVE